MLEGAVELAACEATSWLSQVIINPLADRKYAQSRASTDATRRRWICNKSLSILHLCEACHTLSWSLQADQEGCNVYIHHIAHCLSCALGARVSVSLSNENASAKDLYHLAEKGEGNYRSEDVQTSSPSSCRLTRWAYSRTTKKR